MSDIRPIRVLHSFPRRLGKERVCTTAWHEIDSAADAGAQMTVIAADSVRPFAKPLTLRTTLSRGGLRLPARAIEVLRYLALHDWLVSRMLPGLAGHIDIVHAWPMGALHTSRVARRLGIPVALERSNTHTRFFYDVVAAECERIGVQLPANHEYAYNARVLQREEQEYELANALLCPSDFVVRTFLDKGYPQEKLVRFIYGVDEAIFRPGESARADALERPLTMLFVGVCAVLKGLHFALESWLASTASRTGTFLIAGDFLPDYRAKLAQMLAHPSVKVLGHRSDIPDLMRESDLLVLPSITEGFGLVCTEAMASGCVPLVSEACTELCRHEENALVHPVGHVGLLASQISKLDNDRSFLTRLREAGIRARSSISWSAAGRSLVDAYRRILSVHDSGTRPVAGSS